MNGDQLLHSANLGTIFYAQIIENHNGLISVTSEINKGTTFGIYIPED